MNKPILIKAFTSEGKPCLTAFNPDTYSSISDNMEQLELDNMELPEDAKSIVFFGKNYIVSSDTVLDICKRFAVKPRPEPIAATQTEAVPLDEYGLPSATVSYDPESDEFIVSGDDSISDYILMLLSEPELLDEQDPDDDPVEVEAEVVAPKKKGPRNTPAKKKRAR